MEIRANFYKPVLKKLQPSLQNSRQFQPWPEAVSENCDLGCRACYFEVLDVICSAIEDRFGQLGFQL